MNIILNRHDSIGYRFFQMILVTLVCSSCGGGTGSKASIPAPTITVQPSNQSVAAGTATGFWVNATGEGKLTYQWKRNGVDVNGATSSFYSLTAPEITDTQSKWTVLVRNSGGSVTSAEAILKVSNPELLSNWSAIGEPMYGYNRRIAIDSAGNVFITQDTAILKVTPNGITTILAGDLQQSGSDDGMGLAARFTNLAGIASDKEGNLFVADTGNRKIRKITPTGIVSTFAGNGSDSGVDGVGTLASLRQPRDIAIDKGGNFYVSEVHTHIGRPSGGGPLIVVVDWVGIRKITQSGVVSTFFIADVASLLSNGIYGIAVDQLENVYVSNGTTIQKITPTGVISLLAGGNEAGYIDAVGVAARFGSAQGLTADSDGNIYVIDRGIRKITSTGIVSTVIANPIRLGSNTGDWISNPSSSALAVDSIGVLYFSDQGTPRIVKFQL